jgi:hypothetical protein
MHRTPAARGVEGGFSVKKRFFATIVSPSTMAYHRLATFGIDLVHGSAQPENEEPTIEAVVTLDDVERLVELGYRVQVEEAVSKRVGAHQTVDVSQWLREIRA